MVEVQGHTLNVLNSQRTFGLSSFQNQRALTGNTTRFTGETSRFGGFEVQQHRRLTVDAVLLVDAVGTLGSFLAEMYR
jgi:hypothetical protein